MAADIQIPGLSLDGEVGRGAQSVLYRADKGGERCTVKVLRAETANGDAARYQREATMLACVEHPGLAAIRDVGRADGLPYVVMEYFDGTTLVERIAQGVLPERRILSIAVQVASALAEIHKHNLVHRHVTPANILVDAEGGVKLVDFGFDPHLGTSSSVQDASRFTYTAPELAGALHRPIDGRCDLYALGVVLFECATGRPPFISSDPTRLLDDHLRVVPPSLTDLRPDSSLPLTSIVARLLEKEPALRYPSARELLSALAHASGDDSTQIALRYDSIAPSREGPLAGREAEFSVLRRQWKQALGGVGTTALVEGGLGSGKTRLVNELTEGARQVGALVLNGRCGPDDPLPFAPMLRAIDRLVDDAVGAPPAERGPACDILVAAAGDAPDLVARISPRLAELLGVDAREVGATQATHDEFFEAISTFLVRLVSAYPAAVLFIDDVEWIDHATRQVLRRLFDRTRELPLLIVATASSDPEHLVAVKRFASDAGEALAARITLEPLNETAVGRMVSRLLGGRAVDSELVREVASRSDGNPLAVGLLVQGMLQAGALRPHWGRWIAVEDRGRQLDLPTDLLQLAVQSLLGVSANAQNVLSVAAVIGSRFHLELLEHVVGGESGATTEAVTVALRTNLVAPAGGGHYEFRHHRVREALLQALPPESLRAHHQRIAEIIASSPQAEAQVYSIARHYTQGEQGVSPQHVVAANSTAGLRALDTYADEEARMFLEVARETAITSGIGTNAVLEETLGDVCARTGRMAQAIAHFESAIAASQDRLHLAELRARLALVRLANGDVSRAREVVRRGFSDLGRRLPRTNLVRGLVTLWDAGVGWLFERLGRRGAAGELQRSGDRALARLFEVGAMAAFYGLDHRDLVQMTYRALRPALRHGAPRELARVYTHYAAAAASAGRSDAARAWFAKADRLSAEAPDGSEQARISHCKAVAWNLSGDVLAAEAEHRRCLTEDSGLLEPFYFLNGTLDMAWNLVLRGYPKEALHWVEAAHQRTRAGTEGWGVFEGHPVNAYIASTLALVGRVTESKAHLHRYEGITHASADDRYRTGEFLAHSLVVHQEAGQGEASIEEIAARFESLGVSARVAPMHLRHFYVFQVHATIEALRERGDDTVIPDRLRSSIRSLSDAATVPILQAHCLYAEGVVARLDGQPDQAERRLSEAARIAREIDAPWVLGEVAHERALSLRQRTRVDSAEREARMAYQLASECGRFRHARLVAAEFGLETEGDGGESTEGETTISMNLQRHFAALLRVSLASATVVDPEQRARVAVDEIVTLLGAERAFLLLASPGTEEMVLTVGRDAKGNDLDHLESYSQSVVRSVRSTREPVIVNGTADREAIGSVSAVLGIRAVIAAPLMLRERLIGIVYLDNRVSDGLFTRDDAEILIAIGNHIALALETVRTAQTGMYQRVAANVPGMLFQLVLESEGGWSFQFASDGCRDLFGLEPDAAMADGSVFFDRIHEEDREDLRRSLTASARTLSPWRWEGRSIGTGVERWVQGAGRPERQGTGAILWDGLLMDITNRRAAEDALERQAKELARSNRDLEQFAYAASHDLQEPLRVVASYLQLLTKRYSDALDEEAVEFIDYAVDGATRMQGMIRALLKYSRAGTRPAEIEPTDLGEVFENACANLQTAIDESGAELDSETLPTLPADEAQMVQLFQNLLGNAIKFRGQRTPHIDVRATRQGEVWRFEIEDNGIGIAADNQERVFGIFQRLHTRTDYPGSGVGLAICKKIVERHGGEMGIESEPGMGTIFWFTLPIEQTDVHDLKLSTLVTHHPGTGG